MSTNPPVTDRFRAGRPSTTSSATRRRALRAVTVVTAVLAAVLVWILIVPIFGVDLIVTTGGGTTSVTAIAVAGAALLAGAAGWALLATLEHLTRSAVPAWTVVAGVVLVVSLAGPLAAGSAIATASLIVLHILVGTVVVLGMRRSARRW
jgi:hypothetical protein